MLMIGPLGGTHGGATVLFRQLVAELMGRSDVEVEIVDTTLRERSMGGKVRRLLSTAVRVCRRIVHNDIVSLHVSWPKKALFGWIIALACALTKRTWMLRVFGDASSKHRRSGWWIRLPFDRLLRCCPLLLVESLESANYFRPLCRRVEWYPNSRPARTSSKEKRIQQTTRFLFLGQVTPAKGVREIVAAARMLTSFVRVNIFGRLDGIQASEFSGNVHYCGEALPRGTNQILAEHDVLLLPTYYEGEGYPGVILEAFAAGLPVIATWWQAIPEIVTEGNGLLVEPGDALQLAAAMEYLVQFPEELRRLRAGALKSAKQFDSSVWTGRFMQLATELTVGRAGNQPQIPA